MSSFEDYQMPKKQHRSKYLPTSIQFKKRIEDVFPNLKRKLEDMTQSRW